MIGASPITSFSDGTTEATVAANLYEQTARDMLTRHRWHFASGQKQLSRLVDAPLDRWDAAYQLPADILRLSAVLVNNNVIAYDVYQDNVYCNASENDEVYADYIYRAIEEYWPPYFTKALEFELASIFAYSVAAQEGLSGLMEKRALRQLAIARNIDSQGQTTKRLNVQRYHQLRTTTRG